MPKVLIREWDNSTTGLPTSNNYTVVVPGFLGEAGNRYIAEYEADDTKKIPLLVSDDVYEVTSQADFVSSIGYHSGTKREATAPILEEINTTTEVINTTNVNDPLRYMRALTVAEVVANKDTLYAATIEDGDSEDEQKGFLVRTFTYTQKVEQQKTIDGEPQFEEDGETPIMEWVDGDEVTKVVRLTKVTDISAYTFANDTSIFDKFCIIKKGNEGSDEIADEHIGNQIAYELLGLGYTVLFKRIKTSVNELNEPAFWAPLKDKSVFNFRYVMTGGYYNAAAMNQICALANFKKDVSLEDAETLGHEAGRGDCIALCDIDESATITLSSGVVCSKLHSGLATKDAIEYIGEAAKRITANEYSAIFGPKVTYAMESAQYTNKTFPASFHYLACAARTFDRYNEWYAVAGYNRGISNYSIAGTTVKLGEIAINTLAPRKANSYTTKAINLILHERGNYYLWGNRTGYALDADLKFHHFLNIRQLCCSIKKQLFTACKQFTFDPNSDLLWINFVNAIKPTLDAMKADQGIKGYTITRIADETKALLKARIRIVPIEAVEDFDISIYLEKSLTGITVNADEAQA